MACPSCAGMLCGDCHGAGFLDGTVPKYGSLQAEQYMIGEMTVERCDLNQLLMDAAKWGREVYPKPIHEYLKGHTKPVVKAWVCAPYFWPEAATPIEAALVALAKAEGMEEIDEKTD